MSKFGLIQISVCQAASIYPPTPNETFVSLEREGKADHQNTLYFECSQMRALTNKEMNIYTQKVLGVNKERVHGRTVFFNSTQLNSTSVFSHQFVTCW